MANTDYLIPSGYKMLESHEYVSMEDEDSDRVRVGITHHATELLGDIVYIELPDIGDSFEKGDSFGSIESVKAASDLYMPVSGEIVAINSQLVEEPELVNHDCYKDGWMIEVIMSNTDELKELMDAKAYLASIDEG